ncbi:MAG: InlB B-repeat-containing protein [Clostridia bacterium]|nr:InlB B-repeat-containing protein [Clostridia bacterium]
MKNTVRILMCMLLALVFIFGGVVACGKDEEEGGGTVLITFDYSEYEGVEWDEDFDEEMEVEAGEKIGDLPAPKLEGYTFKGWYEDVEDSTTKLKKTTKPTEDATYYALFVAKTEGGDSSGGNSANCAQGLHQYAYEYTTPTCDAAGTQTMKCSACGYTEIDPLYSTLPANKALGHKWAEDGALDQEGWTVIPLAKKRACLREGCTEVELETFTDITGKSTVTTTGGFYGGLKADVLIDGKWGDGRSTQEGGDPCLSSSNGSAWSVTFSFENATDVDQIVFSVEGKGNGSGKPVIDGYEVRLLYSGATDYEEEPIRSGYFATGEWGRENGHCIDLSNIDKAIMGIKVDILAGAYGTDYFYEVAVAQIPEEE